MPTCESWDLLYQQFIARSGGKCAQVNSFLQLAGLNYATFTVTSFPLTLPTLKEDLLPGESRKITTPSTVEGVMTLVSREPGSSFSTVLCPWEMVQPLWAVGSSPDSTNEVDYMPFGTHSLAMHNTVKEQLGTFMKASSVSHLPKGKSLSVTWKHLLSHSYRPK